MQTAQGKLISSLPLIELPSSRLLKLYTKASRMAVTEFLRNLVKAVSYRIHTVLTDNGIQFTNRICDRYASEHIFDRVCMNGALNIVLPRSSIHGPMDRSSGWTERLKKLLSNGSITTITLSYAFTLLILLLHTTSTADSKHSGAWLPTNSSANSGQMNLNFLRLIRSIKCRD